MSVNSSITSILKKSGRTSVPRRSVRFQLVDDLETALRNHKKNKTAYLDLVCNIRDAAPHITDDELLRLMKESRKCVIAFEELQLFVKVLLIIKWANRREDVVSAFQEFLLDLCSVYSFYTSYILYELVSMFLEVNENAIRDSNGISEEEERVFNNVHYVIKNLLHINPLSINVLLETIKSKFPFKKSSPLSHFNYVHNILNVTKYAPKLRPEIMNLIVNKLIYIDVVTPKEEIEKAEMASVNLGNSSDEMFMMEVDEMVLEGDMKYDDARTLDLCLYRIYAYLHDSCYDQNEVLNLNKSKSFYRDLLSVFETMLLPTHASHHVQFIWFHFLSFDSSLAEEFITFLWNKVVDVTVPAIIKQTCLCYISGLVARANYVSIRTLKNVIKDLSSWALKYIETNDATAKRKVPLVCLHSVFYSACHALFYLVAFRHQELFSSKKDIRFVEKLNLGRIVTCRFDPLNICSETIGRHFASVMHKYQLTYCSSVLTMPKISKRSYSLLPLSEPWKSDFYPFDSYVLRRSGKFLWNLFRDHEDIADVSYDDAVEKDDLDNENEDDFIPMSNSPYGLSFQSSPNFVYSTSPAFSLKSSS